MAISFSEAQAKLTLWMAADDAVAKGQEYTIGGRSLTRANAREIRSNIEFWEKKVRRLERGGIRVRGITPA